MRKPVIHSIEDVFEYVRRGSRPLCLFSGGLDGAYLLHRLSEIKGAEVTALTVNLGGEDDVDGARDVAQKLGARSIVLDKQKEFGQDFVTPALQSQSILLGAHPISASLSRPLLAKTAFSVAKEQGCDVIIHTATTSQNSLRRFNGALMGLGFDGPFGTPYERTAMTRDEKRRALEQRGITGYIKRDHSIDSNLWCREFESGTLEDPEHIEVPEAMYRWSKSIAPQKACRLAIRFEKGVPTHIDDRPLDFVQLVRELNVLAGSYVLGRYVGLEEILSGAKVQEVREMPAAFVLLDALRRLESASLSSECIREKMHLEQIWTREASEGRWFFPLREAAQAFIQSLCGPLSGTVTYELRLRELRLMGIKASHALYVRDRDAYEEAA